jgi:tRNA A-37 threonylcarbamoyl transferase component Bud32
MSEETNRRIGDYEILGVLGAGGMGKVFKVRNVITDRIEAMKVLLPDLAGRQEVADRFLREIRVVAGLNHPNIGALRTALTLGNQLVMIMEYVEGMTLAARLEREPIPLGEALNYVDQVLAALTYAHAQHIIHRDIKPGNMMVTPEGLVKLMDFGIARDAEDRSLTTTGTTLGSLYYMSPEQVKGEVIDERADLYSLGVSLYEMVTRQRPFQADSDYSLMSAQVQQSPKPPAELQPDLPPAVNDLILTAMAKEPTHRFQSAKAFRAAVNNLQAEVARTNVARQSASTATPSAATSVFQGATPAAPPPPEFSRTSQIQMPQAQVPQAQPQIQPVPSVMELSPRPGSGRGFYMALGAVVVLLVLVAAGISVPRWLKTRANERTTTPHSDQTNAAQETIAPPQATNPGTANSTGTSQSADSIVPPATNAGSGTSSGLTNAGGATPSTATELVVKSAERNPISASKKSPKNSSGDQAGRMQSGIAEGGDSSANGAASSAAKDSQGADAGQNTQDSEDAQLEQLEQEVDQLSSRATAAADSVESLRRQQSAQGLGLRGDIASAEELMKTNLDKAQQALQNRDVKNAKKYMERAEPNVEKVEKFLGR